MTISKATFKESSGVSRKASTQAGESSNNRPDVGNQVGNADDNGQNKRKLYS